MSVITINVQSNNDVKLDTIVMLIKRIGDTMVTQADLDVLTTQVTKVMTEVVDAKTVLMTRIAELQAIIDAGLPVLDLEPLKAAVMLLDDLHVDVPPPVV